VSTAHLFYDVIKEYGR